MPDPPHDMTGYELSYQMGITKGQAVVMGFRPHWRRQPHNTLWAAEPI